MNYMIVYSSLTGNTRIIAEVIKDTLKKDLCVYCGGIDGVVSDNIDIIFIGFWVNKGSCPDEIRHYLKSLKNQKIALFGTAGFGGSDRYFKTIFEDVKSYISKSNSIIGNFMCQGKMTQNVLKRYSKMLDKQPNNTEILGMINNYNNALSHPDENDMDEARIYAEKILSDFND